MRGIIVGFKRQRGKIMPLGSGAIAVLGCQDSQSNLFAGFPVHNDLSVME